VKKRVLVVDDDGDFVALTKAKIEADGYEVDVAYGGEEALATARARKPDVIVLDVMMPGLNGLETCAALKSDAATRYIPVILLTAVDRHVSHAFYSGRRGQGTEADDYLVKPADPGELMKAIRRHVRQDPLPDILP
jgi:DNA-binding response OmpR family regulator